MSISSLVNYANSRSGIWSDPAPHDEDLGITRTTIPGLTMQQSGVTIIPSGSAPFDESPALTGVQDDET
jgi:hypothetical protein